MLLSGRHGSPHKWVKKNTSRQKVCLQLAYKASSCLFIHIHHLKEFQDPHFHPRYILGSVMTTNDMLQHGEAGASYKFAITLRHCRHATCFTLFVMGVWLYFHVTPVS